MVLKPEFWIDAIKTLGVPVVAMSAMMFGFWQISQQGMGLAERFVGRAISQMDEQATVLRKINDDVSNNTKLVEQVSGTSEELVRLHNRILATQEEAAATLKRIEKSSEAHE